MAFREPWEFTRSPTRVGRGSCTRGAAAIIDDTLEDLRSETDPRRAVVAAYARMERVLAVHGLPRDRAEAPAEYLERAAQVMVVGKSLFIGDADINFVTVRRAAERLGTLDY